MPVERAWVILGGCGLADREIRAIDLPDIHPVPDNPDGFGITGPTGVGKTVTLAKHLGAVVQRIIERAKDPEKALAPRNFARWANWPCYAEALKSLSGPHDRRDLDDYLEGFCSCDLLYLDDLGQERIKGEDDFSLGLLRVILDSRYRYERPIFWTSNLGFKELSATYGARTVSRMVEAWAPVKINGEDLRMRGLQKVSA